MKKDLQQRLRRLAMSLFRPRCWPETTADVPDRAWPNRAAGAQSGDRQKHRGQL
jgi:hypothetical protein